MTAVRHLGIVLPPYETTYEVSVAGRSCLSNFMLMIHRSEAVFGPRHGCGWASTTGDTGTVRVGSINALSQTSNTCTSLVKHRLIEVSCSFTEAYI